MAEKLKVVRGIYIGLMDRETGKLVLIRRTRDDSALPGVSFRGNWELPGGAVLEPEKLPIPYNYYLKELAARVKAKSGIDPASLHLSSMPALRSVVTKLGDTFDEASVTPLTISHVVATHPTFISSCDYLWVSPSELKTEAERFKPADESKNQSGEGLVSGYGKRMHCMCLAALECSPNDEFSIEASEELYQITSTWE